MRRSRKFISMPVISLEDGLQIGQVRGLVVNPVTKTVSALLVDQKKWFKEQKIIPFMKIRSIGDDAITIEKNSTAQRPANLPEIISLLKEKVELIGAKVIAENGTTLGYVDDYYITTNSGEIVGLEISGNFLNSLLKGKAHLSMEHIRTIGKKVLVAAEGAENYLEPVDGGLQETLRNLKETSAQLLETTWEKTVDFSKNISKKLEKEDGSVPTEPPKEDLAVPEQLAGENQQLETTGEQIEAVHAGQIAPEPLPEEKGGYPEDSLPEDYPANGSNDQRVNGSNSHPVKDGHELSPVQGEDIIIKAGEAEILTEPDLPATNAENSQCHTENKA